MDLLIRCYFEEFTKLPRNTLHDRRNRRNMVEYISTLIEGCRRGEECDVQKTTRDAIVAILRFHEDSRLDNGQVCMMGKFHNVLYVAAKLCYVWQLRDTPTVMTLLESIYSCEKTFERLFIGAIFGNRAPHYIAGWKSDFDDQEENLRAMVYFIDHATNGSLELEWAGKMVRFIDLPIESCGRATLLKLCVQLNLPDKLHILLRYGALINNVTDETDLVEFILIRLMEFFHVYPYNIVACLQLILRVIPRIGHNAVNQQDLKGKYCDLIDDCIVPLSRCGIQPPELKHLSRCAIRFKLWKNYQLPNGIYSLPIPEKLKRYIDIMED